MRLDSDTEDGMNIAKHLNWTDPQITISDDHFDIEISNNEVEIICEWDYGHGGRGTERCYIPIEVLETALREYKEEVRRRCDGH